MGIRFECPNGHHLNVKEFLAGKRGICPDCDARFIVPVESGGRAEAVVDGGVTGSTVLLDSLAARAMAAEAEAAQPETGPLDINLVASTPHYGSARRRRSLERAKSATLVLSAVVFLLLVLLVVVLVR